MRKSFSKIVLCLGWTVSSLVSTAQKTTGDNLVATTSILPQTNIISSESSPLPLVFKNASYNPIKKFLPYYIINKETSINEQATPILRVKRTSIIKSDYAAVIKREFNTYLSSEFELTEVTSISGNTNYNTYYITPIRKLSNGSYEELLEYDVEWRTSANANRVANTNSNSKSSSVLSSGKWYKIGLSKTGIYKLDKTFLQNMGIDLTTLNPKNIRVYGNGGASLPFKNNAFRYDDLEENAIEVVGESDNTFDNSDYVLFYAKGFENWKHTPNNPELHFDYETNYASDSTYYFVNVDLGIGKRVTTVNASTNLAHNKTSNSYDFYDFHELNTVNFLKSGRDFVGEYFDINGAYTFNFQDGNFSTTDSVRVFTSLVARSNNLQVGFTLSSNGFSKSEQILGPNLNFSLADYGSYGTIALKYLNNNPSNISTAITKTTGAGTVGWLDKLILNARRGLVFNTNQFNFRDERVRGVNAVCEYNLVNNNASAVKVWNVSNRVNAFNQAYASNGNNLSFKTANDSLLEFVMFSDASAYTPKYMGQVANQNLHAITKADYVIVCPPQFLPLAQRLANVHQANEQFSYAVVTTDQVYNEFSSGRREGTAIRDFARMIYTRSLNDPDQLKYLLLMGDGSYQNKEWYKQGNTALIPTYQTKNFTSITLSTVSDDFYGMLDVNEGPDADNDNNMGLMDIGVGRFPTKTYAEAEAMVKKIETYYKKNPPLGSSSEEDAPQGDWRQTLTFLADDEDYSEHMRQANDFASSIELLHPQYNIEKIFLDAYQQISTPGGQRYPDAFNEMQTSLQKGTLLFNYTGHGGEVGLTAERLIDIPTINGWKNKDKLPFFVTGTCEFSRYDDPDRTSAGELCVLNPNGGAVSMITTVRIAFSTVNASFNQKLLETMFAKNPNGTYPTVGDIMRKTKVFAGSNPLNMNFHLLGDPALTLAYPKYSTRTTNINTKNVTVVSDTISGLEKVTVKGFVSDTLGIKLSNFNGIIFPTVYDKKQKVICLLNDQSSIIAGGPFNFNQQRSILHKGKSSVVNGDFEFTFIVPKDVNTAYGIGKISYYAYNSTSDAGGYSDKIIVGGFDNNAVVDNGGPSIKLFMNDKTFVNGGTTDENPNMLADLFDVSGLNVSGNGIGHEMTVVLDENTSKPIILNDFYEAGLNDYQVGSIKYPFKNLTAGNHKLTLKVWDVQNNSSATSVDFVVAEQAEMALNHVLNYPNPFSNRTKFFFEHNQKNSSLDVNIQIFTVSGKLAKTIRQTVKGDVFRPEGIEWDGKDDYGDKLAKGVYVYKVQISDNQNKKAEKIEKLVILN